MDFAWMGWTQPTAIFFTVIASLNPQHERLGILLCLEAHPGGEFCVLKQPEVIVYSFHCWVVRLFVWHGWA